MRGPGTTSTTGGRGHAPLRDSDVGRSDGELPELPPAASPAAGLTGLRALAALRDGPLEEPLEAPPPEDGGRTPDSRLPPLLRERARQQELAAVLSRALRAEAARHGIRVDRS